MSVNKQTDFGKIKITNNAVAAIVADAAMEVYGVVGICHQDKFTALLKRENLTKGIIVKGGKSDLEISLYILIVSGVKVTEVLRSVQKKVKYVVEKTLEAKVGAVNVYVQDLKKVD